MKKTFLFTLFFTLVLALSGTADAASGQDQARTALASPLVKACSDGPMPQALPQIVYIDSSPMVVDVTVVENVKIQALTDGTITSAEIVHNNGSTYPLSNSGGGLFEVVLTHDQVLYDYANTKQPNVNWYGYLDFYAGSTKVTRLKMEIGVFDDQIPPVTVTNISHDTQATPYLVNVTRSFTNPTTVDRYEVIQHFYEFYDDDYDFINLITAPESPENRHYIDVRNDVSGIGLPIFDQSWGYGSSGGRLQGVVRYPIPVGYYDMAERAASHEFGHRWINFLSNVNEAKSGVPHWPISNLARGIMGFSLPGSGAGGTFPFEFVSLGNGNYKLQAKEISPYFTDMDLYLMGLIDPASVGSYLIFSDQTQTICDGCIWHGPTMQFTVSDIVNAYGARKPAYPNSQTHFHSASIIVSPTKLSQREMAYFSYFTRRGEGTIPLWEGPYFYPWAAATGLRSTLSTGLGTKCKEQNPIDLWFFSHTVSPDVLFAGQDFSFTASATNSSSHNAHNVTFFDYLPEGLELVSAKLNGGNCYGDKLIMCTRDIFYAGESVTLQVTVRAARAGSFDHTVGISSCSYDHWPSDNATTLRVNVNPGSGEFTDQIFLPVIKR